MGNLNRRDFLKQSAGVVALTMAGTSLVAEDTSAALMRRPLGKTGLNPTLLAYGTGTHAWNGKSDQNKLGREAFVGSLRHAYDIGLRFYDLADMYGSHDYMKGALKEGKMDRSDLTILSKTVAKDAASLEKDLDRFRKEVDTDYFDVILLHCMTEAGWEEKLKPCRDVLSKAKEKGIVKACGVSCHDLGALKAAAESDWVEVILSRINPFGVKMDGTPEEIAPVLQTAHKNGKGVVGMKILGEGERVDGFDESLRYVLGLGCLDAMTIGFLNSDQVDDAVARIQQAAKAVSLKV